MAIFPNLCVRLKLESSKYFNVWMPVPLYLSGVVIIFAFLDLGKNISFSESLRRRSQVFR
jgi:hypothetical protein